MKILDGRTLLSGSNLKRSMGCAHAAILAMAPGRGIGLGLLGDSDGAALLQGRAIPYVFKG